MDSDSKRGARAVTVGAPANPGGDDTAQRERLDRAVAGSHPHLSRTRARQLIAAGAVFVNGRRCKVAGRIVGLGDLLRVATEPVSSEVQSLPIVYEDSALIAIDKPAGMPSAPTRVAAAGTALEVLRDWLSARDQRQQRLWLVHRLDAHTSGLLLFARSRSAAAALSAAFRAREIRKEYIAHVGGVVGGCDGRIELALSTRRGRAIVDGGGKPAITDWRVLQRNDTGTLVQLWPRTGRLHQIRAHLAAIGHPVSGDRAYSGPPARRLMLHASALRIAHPTNGAPLELRAPIPLDWDPPYDCDGAVERP